MSRNTEANRRAYYEASKEDRICPCGRTFRVTRFSATAHCSLQCGNQFRKGYCALPKQHPVMRLSSKANVEAQHAAVGPLRQAIADGNRGAIVMILKADTVTTIDGCWEWQRALDKSGYGRVCVGPRGKTGSVHRVMAEAAHGPLGIEPVHHRCANIKCINPAHLQPISHRENIAEMMQRNYFIARIAELESALADIAPTHPKLLGRSA